MQPGDAAISRPGGLFGRLPEIARIDALLARARAGRSAALVIRGEAGVGKSALLEYAAGSAADMRVLRCAGTESESELAFAALHLLLRPGLRHLDALPGPQAAVLRGVFGLAAGPPGVLVAAEIQLDRFGDAMVTVSEGLRLAADTGQPLQAATLQGNLAWLNALGGDGQRCRDVASQAMQGFAATDNPTGGTWAEWALALLDLSGGNYDAALDRLETIAATPGHRAIGLIWLAADQIEAAARRGSPDRAAPPLARLTDWAEIAPPQPATWAVIHRCRALAGPEARAEEHYRAALRLHATSGRPYQEARTELLYGEWL